MTGPEHYREAERRLLMAWEDDRAPENSAHLVAEAQVHATLALAAATAVCSPAMFGDGSPNPDLIAWTKVAGVKAEPVGGAE